MKTQEFFNLLGQHSNKELVFEYAPNQLVGANYHITEVKHITVDSVDCGAQTDAWKETIVQLWESPKEKDKRDYMTVSKAESILNKVGSMKPYVLDAEIKFEYSNANFHTAQLFVNDFKTLDNQLIIKLAVDKTKCKANELCGIPEVEQVLEEAEACCSPSGGCC